MAHFTATQGESTPGAEGKHGGALAILATVFFMWGFITVLNDVLIPHLRSVFDLNYAQATLVQFVFFGTYFLISLPAAKLLERLGYQRTISVGLATTGVGALIFIPAATLPSYGVFLAGLFVLASGITTLQVAANPYVALLGPPATASSRLNLVQAFNSLGTTVAPVFGGLLILSQTTSGTAEMGAEALTLAERTADALAVRVPYVGIAVVLFLLSLVIFFWRLPAISTRAEKSRDAGSIWSQARLLLGLGAIFFYVGAEIAVGSFLINYISSADVVPMSHAAAAFYVTLFWGGAMTGRFLGSAIMRKVAPAIVLASVSVGAAALLAVTMGTSGWIALWAIVFVGLMNSIMFPTIFTLAIEGLGTLTARGSALLIMAIVGGALIPLLQGIIADAHGLSISFLVPMLCYVYVLGFAAHCMRRPVVGGVEGPVIQEAV
jgi:FHS family L-fucose permease-like MFS transporter